VSVWRTTGAVVAGALVVGAVFAVMRTRPPADAVVGAGVPAIEMAPVDVLRDSLRFTWTSVGSGARYRLELLDASGTPLTQQETRDTTLAVARGTVGSATSWWVRGTDVEGRARLSDVRPVPQ
jgi:hypothetical protein